MQKLQKNTGASEGTLEQEVVIRELKRKIEQIKNKLDSDTEED